MTSINKNSNLTCPSCYSQLTKKNKIKLICDNCNIEYPIFRKSFPILIKDSKKYLVKYIIQIENEIERLNRITQTINDKQILDIISEDIQLLISIKLEITNFINIDDILKHENNTQELGYFNFKEYLIRDWSNSKDSEKELHDIIIPLRLEISKYSLEGKIALIPGCGLGRISYELSDIFSQVYSFDISLTMINMTNEIKLNRKNIKTYNTKNSLLENDKYKEFHINIKDIISKQKQKSINRVINFVGNSNNIPLPDNSVDIIISVYFSDVIPMSEYLEEFTRVLKPNGIFIHFGPLDYHFNDLSQHHSLETFFSNLENKGFRVNKKHQLVKTVNSNNSLNIKGYHNILFSAAKEKVSIIDLKTKLYFDKPFEFNIKGSFKGDFKEDNQNSSIIFYDGTTYTNTETVFKTLAIFKEGYNVKQIIKKLNLKGKKQEKDVFDLIQTLITKKVFKT